MIFLIALGANNSFYVKSIATYAPTFFGYIISVLAIVAALYWNIDTLAAMMQISFNFIPTKYYLLWKFEPEIKQQIEYVSPDQP